MIEIWIGDRFGQAGQPGRATSADFEGVPIRFALAWEPVAIATAIGGSVSAGRGATFVAPETESRRPQRS
jgi:hypothetical protein